MSLPLFFRSRGRPRLRVCIAAVCALLFLAAFRHPSGSNAPLPANATALVREFIDNGEGDGGRWYIPPTWLERALDQRDLSATSDLRRLNDLRPPRTPSEAATLALDLAIAQNRFLNNTKIPLIIHQTWKNLESHTWSPVVQESVNLWLRAAVGEGGLPQMAYIMWDDDGVKDFMNIYEKPSCTAIDMMPYKVEKADVFRVAVLKWFGGVYGDVDTKPLKHPWLWIQPEDIQPWTPPNSDTQYLHEPKLKSYHSADGLNGQQKGHLETWDAAIPDHYQKIMEREPPSSVNVAAIVGLEADNPPDKDDYWRMGYSYAVQLTNWAMAIAPQHPIAVRYLHQVTTEILQNSTRLKETEILDLTGPPAFTKAVKDHCEWDDPAFDWNSVTGRADPFHAVGKIVAGDVAVLPITGFSPGRKNLWPHKGMGSQSMNHTQARLVHSFAGSWRHKSIKVEYGKFCRTFFGLCKDWSKMP